KTDLKLVIVGDAPYSENYKAELKRIADPRAIFTGYVFGEGYQALSCNAYAFVLPSQIDGTRPVLLEQLGFGNCVLVCNSPGNLEVIGDSGIPYEAAQGNDDLKLKLQDLIDHPEMVDQYRKAGPQRVLEKYDWERITDQYEDLFHKLVKRDARCGMRD